MLVLSLFAQEGQRCTQFWLRPSYPKEWILFGLGPGFKRPVELDFAGSAGYDPITDLQ